MCDSAVYRGFVKELTLQNEDQSNKIADEVYKLDNCKLNKIL